MKNTKRLLSAIIIIPVLSVAVSAQGFPWNDFKVRSLKEIVKIDEREVNASQDGPRLIAHADLLLSAVRVKYGGKSRPMSSAKKELLITWTKMLGHSDTYPALYENDFLFTENGVEYWLPVQKKVSSYFPKELKAGHDLDIYIVRAGGVCKKRDCDWLFLVEEFQKPKGGPAN